MPHTTNLSEEDKDACRRVRNLFEAEKSRSKLKHDDVGKMIGRSGKTISAIVNGDMRVTVPVARKLAKVFKVPVTEILPWVAELQSDTEVTEFIADVKDLTPENLEVAHRLVRNLLDSQE